MVVCMRYTNDKDTAQEVLQEGFMKVFEKLGAFDYKGSFEGWVRRIVANTAIDSMFWKNIPTRKLRKCSESVKEHRNPI